MYTDDFRRKWYCVERKTDRSADCLKGKYYTASSWQGKYQNINVCILSVFILVHLYEIWTRQMGCVSLGEHHWSQLTTLMEKYRVLSCWKITKTGSHQKFMLAWLEFNEWVGWVRDWLSGIYHLPLHSVH